MLPKFSIVIPVYNVALYLRKCLDSVCNQTYDDWECICVDDGSTDGSGAILNEYAAKDARIKVVHQTNAGVSAARNAGIEAAVGEYLMYVDSDDWIEPDSLQDFVEVLDRERPDGLLVEPCKYNVKIGGKKLQLREVNVTWHDMLLGKYSKAGGYPFSRIYRHSLFSNVRFSIGVKLREDYLYFAEAMTMQARWTVAEKPFYHYNARNGSASGSVSVATYHDLIDFHPKVAKIMHEKLRATDDDVRRFFKIENLNGVLDFPRQHWHLFDPGMRQQIVDTCNALINYLGFNPYNMWSRMFLRLTGDCTDRCLQKIKILEFFHRWLVRAPRRLLKR